MEPIAIKNLTTALFLQIFANTMNKTDNGDLLSQFLRQYETSLYKFYTELNFYSNTYNSIKEESNPDSEISKDSSDKLKYLWKKLLDEMTWCHSELRYVHVYDEMDLKAKQMSDFNKKLIYLFGITIQFIENIVSSAFAMENVTATLNITVECLVYFQKLLKDVFREIFEDIKQSKVREICLEEPISRDMNNILCWIGFFEKEMKNLIRKMEEITVFYANLGLIKTVPIVIVD